MICHRDLGTLRRRELCSEQPDRAGTEDKYWSTRCDSRTPGCAQRIRARFDHRPRCRVDLVRQCVQRGRWDEELLGKSPRVATPQTHLGSVLAGVPATVQAQIAMTAADLSVAGRSGAYPGACDPHA